MNATVRFSLQPCEIADLPGPLLALGRLRRDPNYEPVRAQREIDLDPLAPLNRSGIRHQPLCVMPTQFAKFLAATLWTVSRCDNSHDLWAMWRGCADASAKKGTLPGRHGFGRSRAGIKAVKGGRSAIACRYHPKRIRLAVAIVAAPRENASARMG